MSLYSDFLKELKKRGLTIDDVSAGNKSTGGASGGSVNIGNSSFANDFKKELSKRGLTIADVTEGNQKSDPIRTRISNKYDDDIAPVREDIAPTKEEDDSLLDFFSKGAFGNIDLRKQFKDGYQFGDVAKTVGNVGLNTGKAILGTAGDIALSAAKGAAGVGEGLADILTYGMSGAAGALGADDFAKATKEYAKQNKIEEWTQGATDYLDQYSVLGRTSDAILQGVGQFGAIAGTAGLGALGGLGATGQTALTMATTGLSSMGSGIGEAYKGGATDGEAVKYGAAAGASDALWELLFGGMGKAIKAVGFSKGLSSLDDIVAKGVTKAISNPSVRNIAEAAVKSGFEGFEEAGSGFTQAVAKKLTYMSEEEFSEILKDENLLEQFIVGAATSSTIQSGYIPGTYNGSVREANNTGRDYITGFSQNEQAVIDKEIEKRISQEEADGKKLSAKERNEIAERVEADMEKGYISTDTIEEALGGETYKTYKHTVESEDAIQKEFDTLNKMKQGEMTGEQLDRRTELKEKLEYLKKNSQRDQLKTKLGEEVMGLVRGDRLAESYNERSRRQQAFQADLSQYNEKQQAVIKRAVESRILNNTNRAHDFVDMVAKLSAETGVLFDFTNNKKLKESGFALNGKTINGYVSKDGIAVNIQSAKALNTVVGHEITHVLKGTELYNELQNAALEFAKSKGEYQSRYDSLLKLYENVEDADIYEELTADLVGDYLFTDEAFINNLSTEHRNVFQKVYDEIKHLLKVATAGSKEARELEKVKMAFDKAFREVGTKNTADSGVKYSVREDIVDVSGKEYNSVVELDKTVSKRILSEPKKFLRYIENNLVGLQIPVIDGHGNTEIIEFAGANETVSKNNRRHPVLGELAYTKGDTRKQVIVNAEEVIQESMHDPDQPSTGNVHGWLDKNGWETRKTYVLAQDGMIYEAYLKIAKAQDGRNILYAVNLDINKGIAVDKGATSEKAAVLAAMPSGDKVAQNGKDVKRQFSLSDTTGRQLSKEQSEYFKDSKVRDENGNLKVMYHGTPNGDFTVFKDGTYFTDNKEYADRYQNPGASSISTGKTASNPKTFEVYLDIKKPFDLSDPEARRIYIEDYIKGGNAMGINPYLSDAEYAKIETIDWTEGEDLRDFLTENGYDYDGLVLDEGADGGYGDEVQRRGKSYVVFSPEQVKNVDNGKPTGDPDIRKSISAEGANPKTFGNYNVYGKDIALEAPAQEDIAPVAVSKTETTTATVSNTESVADMFPDDTATTQEEYEYLLAERDDIRGAMDTFAAVGDTARAEQLMGEYEAVQARIAEIEADDSDRLASIDEADAPPETDNAPEDVADNVPLTKKLVDDLTRSVREQLGLSNRRSNEVRELIQRYSNEEFPSKAHLYTEIEERFGKHTESEIDEDLKGMKALLRTYPINVDESIKGEIADYSQLMRSNFGKVRFSKEGLPVDVAYKEFHEALPGYFPESIYVPTDQLMRIIEVANMDTTMQTEYEIDWQTLEDVTDTIMNGVTEFKQNRKETLANKHGREAFNSLMESADQFVPPMPEDIAPVRKPAIQNIQSDDIAPVFDTSSGQQSLMPEVEVPKKVTRSELHFEIMDRIKTYFRNKGLEFDNVLKNAKDLSTFATVDNTPQRVLEKALGYKEGQMLSEMTVNRVARNETEGIRWLNSFTDKKSGLLQKISKQYGIKPGSKASAAAQMYAEGFYVGENDAIIAYGDKELAADFPDAKVQENIKKLARDPRIRQIYDETLAAINKSRTRNAYPEIPRLDNYFLHFRAMEDTFSRLGLPFNPNDIRAKDLPTDLNGVTADLKPGQPYFASAMHRTGKRTSFDLLGGLEKYLTSAKNQIYHIDDIQTLRALRNYVAETYGQANGLKDLDLLSEEEAEQKIKDVYNSHLSTFAKFLNEEANVIAGKTSLIDRGLEGVIGRRGITFLDTLNRQVGANMVGFNVSSSLTNFLAPVQAFAKSNKYDFVKAMAQTSYNKIASVFGGGDNFAEESPVMIRRKGAERFYRTPYQKVGDAGYVLMGVVDDLSTELIARTKYNELTRKGMSSNQAHYETDKWVSRLMGDRSLGQQPQLYNSKMLGLFTKFQLEVRNQLDSQFYDTIQEAKVSTEEIENKLLRNAKRAAKITSTFAQLAVVQHLFGKAFESVAGYNPAFDIIEALIKTFGWDDEEEEEDTVLDNIEEGFLELLGDLPYTSTLTGGRIPIASALPVTQFIKGEDQYGNEKSRWQTLGEAAPYYVLPGGYGQIKKTKAGMEMFDDDLPIAGSYTDSGGLRFPVEDNLQNRVQAGLFGQWASENARAYFDDERKPLKDKQIQEFIDVDLPIADYWKYRDGLAKQEKLEDKVKYIESLDLPVSKKNILVNNLTDRKNPIDLTNYDEFADYEEFDFASKNPEKYDFLQKNNVSYSEYLADEDSKEFYDSVYSWEKNNPEKVTVSKAVTDSVVAYRQYSKELDAIRADKDSRGKSISGSAKEKKWNYIDNLDIDQGAKYILFKNEYNADDTYNYEIIDYLNGRDDVSRDEMITILKELGFEVHSDGTVTW